MHEDSYAEIKINSNYRVFWFISEGRHGSLVKIVNFDEIIGGTMFNLALGTLSSDGKADFVTITDNGDRNKVLATVARIILMFMNNHPEKKVYITGSDDRRTVLYHRAIAYGYYELIQIFNIYGELQNAGKENRFEIFDKTKRYAGFLIERK